jgi:CubicO group peptidase (beta-lactamase class C family)
MGRFIFTLIILCLFNCKGRGSELANFNKLSEQDSVMTSKQQDLVYEKVKYFPDNTEISIAIIQNGKPLFYGVKRNVDSVVVAKNYNKVFEIGSITKVFTATILANFVLDEKLKLDDAINDYITFPIKGGKEFSFKQLSNHTSGLNRLSSNFEETVTDINNPYQNYDNLALEDYLANKLFLSQRTGEKYQYSNLGAGLLGYLLGEIDSTNYETLLQNEILLEYGMMNTSSKRDKVASKLVKGIDAEGKITANWDFISLVGAGGILSTTEDLSKFVLENFNAKNEALNLTRQKTFDIDEFTSIGLGWHIMNKENKALWYTHSGGTGGYSSSVVINTETKNGVILLSNVSAYNERSGDINTLGVELMNTVEKLN